MLMTPQEMSEIEALKQELAEKDKMIAEKDKMIAKVIAEKDKVIAEKDRAYRELRWVIIIQRHRVFWEERQAFLTTTCHCNV